MYLISAEKDPGSDDATILAKSLNQLGISMKRTTLIWIFHYFH